MPRRSVLTEAELQGLLAFPELPEQIAQHYTLSEEDIAIIGQHRRDPQRMGFAVMLCAMRYPGILLEAQAPIPESVLKYVGGQLGIEPEAWYQYAKRPETRRSHLIKLQRIYGFRLFRREEYKSFLDDIAELAVSTDKGVILGERFVELLSRQEILAPSADIIKTVCSEAMMRGTREFYSRLLAGCNDGHFARLDTLLTGREGTASSIFAWLNEPPGKPTPRHILKHIERLKYINELELPKDIAKRVHQNRLRKLANEGRQMSAQHLRDFEKQRRYATLIASCIDARSAIIDECIDLQERHLRKLQRRARLRHTQHFVDTAPNMGDIVRNFSKVMQVIIRAKQDGTDIRTAIESVTTWDDLAFRVETAERLNQPKNFNPISYISSGYTSVRQYSPALLETLSLKGQSSDLIDAVELLKKMNSEGLRKLPPDAPVEFIPHSWHSLIYTNEGLDTPERFAAMREANELPISISTDCEEYLATRIAFLEARLDAVETHAKANQLPQAVISETGIKISPIEKNVPDEAHFLQTKIESLLPRVKITDILMEVDRCTNFSDDFVHLKSGEPVKDKFLLYTILLADGINLGLRKMSEVCHDTSYQKLSWMQSWHVRSETYSAALARLINAQYAIPFASYWGSGTISSSDGQFFPTTWHGRVSGQLNLKYGLNPGKTIYSFVSDQYAPFHSTLINSVIRDSTYVLDGLLHHESELEIKEHYTDTSGFTEHVFALMHLLGFRFAPRLKGLKDNKLYAPPNGKSYPTLSPLLAPNRLNLTCIRQQWDSVLRLAASVKVGTVTSSLMLRALGMTQRQSALASALRELGRIERTLFMLDWFQSEELRQRVQIGLNKGEARHSLARAVFFNRLGEFRDRSLHAQEHRMSGLNFLTAAIILWNTVYIERAVDALRKKGEYVDEKLLQYTSPLSWEHLALTGDYIWDIGRVPEKGNFHVIKVQ